MPKNKRNKVINLTKVKKKTKDVKDKLIEEIQKEVEARRRVYLVSIENERNNFLQQVRKDLRHSRLIGGRNKVMQTALGITPSSECQENIHKLAQRITGSCALLFSDKSPEEIQSYFQKFRPWDFARTGCIATDTVVLPKGVDALSKLPHSIEAHLRQCGLPTQLKEGKIHLLGDHTVCKKGEELSSDAAQILKLLELKQAQFTMTVEAHWDKTGGKFEDCDEMED